MFSIVHVSILCVCSIILENYGFSLGGGAIEIEGGRGNTAVVYDIRKHA